MPVDADVKLYIFTAHEYLSAALLIIDGSDLANTDLHFETIRAYNRTVEALRLAARAERRSEAANVLQFPIVNSRGV